VLGRAHAAAATALGSGRVCDGAPGRALRLRSGGVCGDAPGIRGAKRLLQGAAAGRGGALNCMRALHSTTPMRGFFSRV